MSSLTHPQDDISAYIDRILEDTLRAGPQPLRSFRPRLDLHESGDSNIVMKTLELPGLLNPDDVTINVYHNRLTVSGESSISQVDKDGHTVRAQASQKFFQKLPLPTGTKAEDVKAQMENGLLTLIFPKAAREQQPRRIAVH